MSPNRDPSPTSGSPGRVPWLLQPLKGKCSALESTQRAACYAAEIGGIANYAAEYGTVRVFSATRNLVSILHSLRRVPASGVLKNL